MTGVYVARAIDQHTGGCSDADVALFWLKHQIGVSWVYNPLAAFTVPNGAQRGPGIRAVNTEALKQAGLLVAFLPAGVVTIGVPMEIESAVAQGKQVVIISDAPSWSLEFGDAPNVRLVGTWGHGAQAEIKYALARIEAEATRPQVVLPPATETPVSPWVQGRLFVTPDEGPSVASVGLPDVGPTLMPTLVSEGAEEPRRGYADDAGLDLIVSEARVVHPGEFVDIPCGVSVELPAWSFGMITGRSSTLRKRGLMVSQGIIDAGYRGPLFAGVWNLTDGPVKVEAGERVAQLIILHNGTRLVQVQQVDEIDRGPVDGRGVFGSGSTGT